LLSWIRQGEVLRRAFDENMGFWVDDVKKTIAFATGAPLIVRRFNDHAISAVGGDVSYEFNRDNDSLSYASTTTKNGTVTIIIGSGQSKFAAGP
jgi:hypothetical protein